jgi:hypothetical protein
MDFLTPEATVGVFSSVDNDNSADFSSAFTQSRRLYLVA